MDAVREQLLFATAEAANARRVRREAVGLGGVSPPNEFMCPITLELMIDPVVASDGYVAARMRGGLWMGGVRMCVG